jgi:hypothetical protein
MLALLREREKLLAKIARKKQSLAKQVALISELQAHMVQVEDRLLPLRDQCEKADQEIHQLFAGLLGKGRLKRKDQRQIRELYHELQHLGILSPGPDGCPDEDYEDLFGTDDADPCSRDQHHPAGQSPDDVAAKRAAPKAGSSLRDIFRHLAVAVHPDRSQTDEDRDRRTEAMKAVTRAYQDGDLARLLELETAWLSAESPSAADEDESERRCASLERTNRELKKQVRGLEAELRALKSSGPVVVAEEFGLIGKAGVGRLFRKNA